MSERAPDQFIEIFLQPGECYFADADTRLRTLLGSCVAITLWHPVRRFGGMCHFLLPTRMIRDQAPLEGRFGDEALFLLLREARQLGCRPRDFEYKVFGGAALTERKADGPERKSDGPERQGAPRERNAIGLRNVAQAIELLDDLGIQAASQNVGGACARSIMLDNWSGDVWVRSTFEGSAVARSVELSL
jgi:chemotaxis protein CheD